MTTREQKGFLIDDWRVSPSQGLLTRGSETVRLEPKAMEVLVYFASRPNEVITREALERDVWHGALVGYDAVTNTIIKLRKALQDDARQPRYIATIPKMGYQLIATITYPDNDDQPPGAAILVTSETLAGAQHERPSWSLRKKSMAMTALAAILAFSLVWLWPVDTNNNGELPSIVVLPFENLSDDPKQEYLADGITEDIITDLSRLSNILVIASNTSYKYKDRQVTPEEVGTDLSVEFVLKGTIRQLGHEVRVNVQLVNAKTGFNTWAQRYDRKVTEVFAVQDEVTHSIVRTLAVKLTNKEKYRLAQRATDNLKAYDFFQEGQRNYKMATKESHEQARVMYSKAIELDPDYGRAYGAQAVTLAADFRRGWTDSPIETLDRALELAKKAVTLDDSTPQTHFALGFVYFTRKEFDNAEKAAMQAISIAPNYADGYGLLALIKSYTGQPKKSIELNNKAIRNNPYYSYEYLVSYGMAYYRLGDYDVAITLLEDGQQRNQNSVPIKLILAASYVKANRLNDARWIAEEIQALSPSTTITDLDKTIPIANIEFKRAFLADLRKAGLPK